MRKIFLVLCLVVMGVGLRAQTFDEWFRQKKTQIKYLLQQIAANKVYIDYLQKGYKIARNGLATINDIKHGDFNLHEGFFNSLKQVNPKIKGWSKVAAILALQVQIIKDVHSAVQHIEASDEFTVEEITYLQNVFDRLLEDCNKVIDELVNVITPDERESDSYQMTDDERIKAIDGIYEDMQGKVSFCKSFSSQAAMLAMQREQEKTDIEVSRRLHGLN